MMEASTAHHGIEREPNEKSSKLRLRRPAHSPSATMPTKYASKTTVSIASRASMGATYQMTNDECRMTNEFVPVKLIQIAASDFDLEKTLNSGQVFHWEKCENGFVGTIGKNAIYVEQRGDILKVRFGEMRALPKIVVRYFALDHPLEEICASLPRDPVMDAARDFCRGLRIIRQPKWECWATFIC